MFGTLRYDSHNDRTEFLDRSARFHVNEQNGFSGQHAACDLCRAKKLRCSGQEHGCDRCKTSSSSCVYSTSRDDGRQKRRRRADNGSTSKNKHEQAIGSTPSVPGAGSAAPPKGYASEREPHLANNTTILPQPEQELQGSMEIFGQSHETAQEISVPPEGKDLLEGLESEFDLVDGGIFDAIPTLNLYTPKSSNESSGNIEKLDMVHDMGFLPRTAQSEAARTRNWDMSPPPSATVTQSSRDMSLEHSEWLLSSPSFHLDPSASERPLQPINRQTFTKPPATPLSCACLVTKVSLLEQLGSHPVDDSLDEVLAVHKTCLGKCWSVLGCGLCMSKSESVMLLVLVYERLVAFCEAVTDAYLDRRVHALSRLNSSVPEPPRLAFGKYPIDKDEEWDCLTGALTLYQVKVLGRQLLAIRKPASTLLRGGQISKLLTCERRMRALAERLRAHR